MFENVSNVMNICQNHTWWLFVGSTFILRVLISIACNPLVLEYMIALVRGVIIALGLLLLLQSMPTIMNKLRSYLQKIQHSYITRYVSTHDDTILADDIVIPATTDSTAINSEINAKTNAANNDTNEVTNDTTVTAVTDAATDDTTTTVTTATTNIATNVNTCQNCVDTKIVVDDVEKPSRHVIQRHRMYISSSDVDDQSMHDEWSSADGWSSDSDLFISLNTPKKKSE